MHISTLVGVSTWSKYCLQNYVVCPTGVDIRYGYINAAHRGNNDVVEDTSNDVDLVRIITGKCANSKKVPISHTLADIVSITNIKSKIDRWSFG